MYLRVFQVTLDGEFKEYRRLGYTVLKGAVERQVIEAVFLEIKNVFRPILRFHKFAESEADGVEFEQAIARLFNMDTDSYLAAAKATQWSPALHALGSGNQITNIVKQFGLLQPLIAVRPVVHILSDQLQVPGGYHRTPPHQDWRSVQGSLDGLVLWFPLVSIDRAFGPLEVIPGSHVNGLVETRRHPFGNVVAEEFLDGTSFVPIEVEPGDAVLFSMFTIHRTGMCQRSGIRWAVSYRYNNAAELNFAARGFPNPFRYKSQDDLLFEDYPSPAEVRPVFTND